MITEEGLVGLVELDMPSEVMAHGPAGHELCDAPSAGKRCRFVAIQQSPGPQEAAGKEQSCRA